MPALGISINTGPVSLNAACRALRNCLGGFHPETRGAEAFREAYEIRVGQIRTYYVAPELFLLGSLNVAVRMVIEYDIDQVQSVFHRGRHFRSLVHKASVPTQHDHFLVRIGYLYSQGRRITVSQVPLVAAADEMPGR